MLELTSLDNLDADEVTARRLRLAALYEGLSEGLATGNGAFNALVLRPHAILGQAYADAMTVVANSVNPILASTDPSAVNDSLLTQAAANFGVTRQASANASGLLRIVVDSDNVVIVPRGGRFTSEDGRVYVATAAYVAKTSDVDATNPTERLLTLNSDGNYEFTLIATADAAGAAGNLRQGATLTPTSFTITGLVSVTAAADFAGGSDEETNAQLIARVRRAVPAKSLSTRASIDAFLTQSDYLPQLLAISTIGAGDGELNRSKSQLLPRVGQVDIYLRTAPLPLVRQTVVTGTVISQTIDNKPVYQFSLDRDAHPGAYRVVKAKISGGEQLTVTAVTRGMDLTPIAYELIPEVTQITDAAFSRFQTLSITATGTAAAANDAVATIEVDTAGLPDIETAQTAVASRSFRFAAGDTLVKAAIPAYVAVAAQIVTRFGVTLPAAATIRELVADYINNLGFAGRIRCSQLTTLINNQLPSEAEVARLELAYEILLPDGSSLQGRTREDLLIPDKFPLGVSSRTVCCFCYPEAVALSPYLDTLPDVA